MHEFLCEVHLCPILLTLRPYLDIIHSPFHNIWSNWWVIPAWSHTHKNNNIFVKFIICIQLDIYSILFKKERISKNVFTEAQAQNNSVATKREFSIRLWMLLETQFEFWTCDCAKEWVDTKRISIQNENIVRHKEALKCKTVRHMMFCEEVRIKTFLWAHTNFSGWHWLT